MGFVKEREREKFVKIVRETGKMATNHLFLAWVSALRETAEAPREEKRRDPTAESAGVPLYEIGSFGLPLPLAHALHATSEREHFNLGRAAGGGEGGHGRQRDGFAAAAERAPDRPTKERKDEEVWEAGGVGGGREGGEGVLYSLFMGVQRGGGGRAGRGEEREGRKGRCVPKRHKISPEEIRACRSLEPREREKVWSASRSHREKSPSLGLPAAKEQSLKRVREA